MADLLLDVTTGDLDISTNDYQIVTGANAIAQHLRIRYRFFLGEWSQDTRLGVPYFREILKKNPNQSAVRAILQNVATETPGVVEVRNFSLDLDGETRALTVEFDLGVDVDGQLVFEPFLVEIEI